jgi:pimeloyl-ACP methyl ester carboxylesterase
VVVDGHPWHYTDQGQGDVVVLVHGLASDSRTWDKVVSALSDVYRVISVDIPGYSVLSLEGEISELSNLADGLHAMMRELGISSYSLVGHSVGGTLALFVACQHPQSCTGLVLLAPGGFGPELNPFLKLLGTRMGSLILAAAYGRRTSRAIHLVAARYLASENEQPRTRVAEVMETYQRLSTRSARSRVRQGIQSARRTQQSPPAAEALSVLSGIPTQIIWGSDDLVLPSWQADQALRLIPRAQLTVLQGAGHTPQRSNSGETAATIITFLRSDQVANRKAQLRRQR